MSAMGKMQLPYVTPNGNQFDAGRLLGWLGYISTIGIEHRPSTSLLTHF